MGPALLELYSTPCPAKKLSEKHDFKPDNLNTEYQVTRTFSVKSESRSKEPQRKLSSSKSMESSKSLPSVKSILPRNKTYTVKYIGRSKLDSRYTPSMVPWIISDIKREARNGFGKWKPKDIKLELTDIGLKGIVVNEKDELFLHPLSCITKFTTSPDGGFHYLLKEHQDSTFDCYVFQAANDNVVMDLMREITKDLNYQSLHGNRKSTYSGIDNIVANSQHYEVMYVGKIRVYHKRPHPSFIDEAVENLKNSETKAKFGNDEESFKFNLDKYSNDLGLQRPQSILSLTTFDEFKETQEEESPESPRKRPKAPTILYTSFDGRREIPKITDAIELRRCRKISEENTRSEEIYRKLTEEVNENKKVFLDSKNLTQEKSEEKQESYSINPDESSLDKKCRQEVKFDVESKSGSLHLPSTSLITNTQSLDDEGRASIMRDLQSCSKENTDLNIKTEGTRMRSASGDVPRTCAERQASLPYRTRTNSGGSSDLKRRQGSRYCNRTMLFLIGRLEICLISPDQQSILFCKTFTYVSYCAKGVKNADHFGFVCRETSSYGTEIYVGYVFRCSSDKLVSEIMHTLKQAFHNAHTAWVATKKGPASCESCPMNWFARLCGDVENKTADKVQAIILNRLDTLKESDRTEVMNGYEGAQVNSIEEQNELFMGLLRALCEKRQSRHVHEGEKRGAFEGLRAIAKKGLTSSVETILKFKSPTNGTARSRSFTFACSTSYPKPLKPGDFTEDVSSLPSSSDFIFENARPRSYTISGVKDLAVRESSNLGRSESTPSANKNPLLNIFMKIGSTKSSKSVVRMHNDSKCNSTTNDSCRPAIFANVQNCKMVTEKKKRTKEELRDLWKKAILQQKLLLRMDKENRKLQDKRMKLDYEEITPCIKENVQLWDDILRGQYDGDLNNVIKKAIKQGIPRNRRGEIWLFIAKNKKKEVQNLHDEVDLDTPYRDLLQQLTDQQHAILVDLGRTFPKHAYYSQTLGPGQLSLFNLLKAYSLFDKQVGYCQGLSFVAAILLLHMSEENAFEMMKYLFFTLGLRNQYKPDMSALQTQLYQITRYLHDFLGEIYHHFDRHEISPTLYAAPWFLTLFASQFPIGFVTRLFDIIFLVGLEAIFRVSIVMLTQFKDAILSCDSFESTMDLLKNDLPSMDLISMEGIFSQVLSMDIEKQLLIYEIEYSILQEEILTNETSMVCVHESISPPENDLNARIVELENENKMLKGQNMELLDQLHVATSNVHSLESSLETYKSSIKRLESRVRTVEDERDALFNSLNMLRKKNVG